MSHAEITSLQDMPRDQARLDRRYPPGRIGVISADLARYHSFTMSLVGVKYPYGTEIHHQRGVDICDSLNKIVSAHLASPGEDWIWIMGDDHAFDNNILVQLLSRMYDDGLDMVAPIVLSRQPPFPTVMGQYDEAKRQVTVVPLQAAQGLQKVDCVGSAGLLVRRKVFQAMPAPWFEAGSLLRTGLGEDWWFCLKARRLGFQTYVDMEIPMGHTIDACIWPFRDVDGVGVRLDFNGRAELKINQTVIPT